MHEEINHHDSSGKKYRLMKSMKVPIVSRAKKEREQANQEMFHREREALRDWIRKQ